jgi:uncharacterized protein (DUF1015 family)
VADVKPFVCCRPVPALAAEVAALPYDVFSLKEAANEIVTHPHSFLRIDKSAALFGGSVGEYDAPVYDKAAEVFASDEHDGVYLDEQLPHYFLYRLIANGHAQTGIVACIAVDDYNNNVLKRHENTRAFKLEDRVCHIAALNAHTGPVLVGYRAQAAIDAAVAQVVEKSEPLYDFTSPDGVQHTVWRVDDRTAEAEIRAGFAALDALYIADGHHRAAAAAQLGEMGEQQGGEAAAFLIVAFPSDQLEILDYNRVVFDTNGLSGEELLARIAESFTVEPQGVEPYKPQAKGEFSLYLDGIWYKLLIHDELHSSDPVDNLDVSLLQKYLLAPILGIDDPRTNKRIAYVGGVRGLDELKRRADESGGASFALYPCSLDELFTVADAGRLMPPKSTWFEPKPRSGLFIHKIL